MQLRDLQQIEELFHAALNYEAGERSAYLAAACAGDDSLRLEVESLLKAFEGKHDFMEQPALSLGMRILTEAAPGTLVGKTIGPYTIMRLLGRGGMGEVYLAEDGRLNRQVALKFFMSRVVDNAGARRQLVKEAQAVARLEHPNICAVYGIEEIDDYNFIVMQYVEGETLDAVISKGQPAFAQAMKLAEQIVGALAVAHAQGVIHRDIKPQNIMVTGDGQVKVLDFGLAKVVQQTQGGQGEEQSQLSQAGLIIGTVPYMSPEQLRGEPLDFRTDVFSAGSLLYELFGGSNPYKRGSEAETISAILTNRPPPLAAPAARVPPALNAIIQKCMEKEKGQRYPTAGELLSALRKFRDKPQRRIRPDARAVAALAVIALLLAGLVFAYLRHVSVPATSAARPTGQPHSAVEGSRALSPEQTLAVLPFTSEDAGAGAESIGNGLTQSLVSQLSRLSRLRVKAPTFVPDLPDGSVDTQKLGHELRVDAVLSGKFKKRGGALILQTALVSSSDGSTIWEAEYDIQPAGMPNLHREIAERVVYTLRPQLSQGEREILARPQTESPEAYKLYLLGRHYWYKRDRENIQRAINYFKQATEIEPLYAQAWAGLADSYVMLPTVAYGAVPTGDAMPKAKAAARRALEIDPALCEAHVSLGVVKLRYEWDWQEAESAFKRAIEINPENASAHFWYANLLNVTGRPQEAIAESERALEIDPFSPLVSMNLGRAYYRARDYDRAIKHFKRTLADDPKNSSASYVLGYVYLQKGMYREAVQIFEEMSSRNKWLAAAPLGYAYARVDRKEEALKILDEMDKKRDLPSQERAIVYLGLGDHDRAFHWLEEAYKERFGPIISLTSDPIFDALRPDPRFADLARRINLTP
jgi:serine/threonine-protein kinase